MKLTAEQKSFLKSIESKKKRTIQKDIFKQMNKIGIVMVPTKYQEDVMKRYLGNAISEKQRSFTKEALRDLTEPKKETPGNFCVEITKENHEVLINTFKNFNKGLFNNLNIGGYLLSNKDTKYMSFQNKNVQHLVLTSNKLVSTEEFLKYIGKEDSLPKEKLYTLDDMRKCFSQSRQIQHLLGFKHDSFASYMESIKE
jgi:predicted HicB family RNase H-like nuclease